MKLFTFVRDRQERVGAESETGALLDLNAAHELLYGAPLPALSSMQALIEGGEAILDTVRAMVAANPKDAISRKENVRVIAPLPRPSKIRDFSCFEKHLLQSTDGAARMLAQNEDDPELAYLRMRKRFNLDSLPGPGWYEIPAYYYSDCTTVSGHDDEVVWPAYSQWADYEVELAAVIGRRGKDISSADAGQFIFGYTLFNDLSARDAQLQAMSTGLGVAKGKDFDGSNALGPCIVTADEIPDPYSLTMRARVNGVEWSASFLGDAKWRFADCIAYASQSQTIFPGEIFATGAGAGGCGLEVLKMIHRGDVIELDVEQIGILRTRIV